MTAQGDRGEPFGRPKQEVAYGLCSLPSARLLSLGPRLPLKVEPHCLAALWKQMVALTISTHVSGWRALRA